MKSLTQWWINYKPLSKEEFDKVQITRDNLPQYGKLDLPAYGDINWDCLTEELRQRVPLKESLANHTLYVGNSGTEMIDALFDKYINDNTLLVTTEIEHTAVKANIEKYNLADKCVMINPMSLYDVRSEFKHVDLSKYTRAFVYIIGTNLTNGNVTPQQYYTDIKGYLESKGIQTILTIDDVHGFYLIPRDYTIFDYVINTGHVLTRRFDMGMLWSKTEEKFGKFYDNWLRTYINSLDIMLERKDKLHYWNRVMRNEFNDVVINSNKLVQFVTDGAEHIFTLKVNCPPKYIYTEEDSLRIEREKEIKLDDPKDNNSDFFYIRIRASAFTVHPEELEEVLDIIKSILRKASSVMQMLENE